MAATTNSKFAILEYALILLTLPFIFTFVFSQSDTNLEPTTSLIPISDLIHPFLNKVLSLLSFMACLWVMTVVNQQYKFAEYSRRSIFVLGFVFAFLFPRFFLLLENGLALLCMSLVLYFLLQVHNQKILGPLLFSTAFFLSVATILNNSTFWFLIVLFISLFILRPFKLKEHLSLLSGYVLPFFYLYGIAFLFDWPTEPLDFGFEVGIKYSDSTVTQIAYVWLIALAILSIFHSLYYRSKMIVRSRKQMTVLLLFFLTALLMTFLNKNDEINVFLMLLPFSVLYALLHRRLPKSWILDILSIAVISVLIISYFGINFID